MVKYIRIGLLTLIAWGATGFITWLAYTPRNAPKLVSAAKRIDFPSLKGPSDIKPDADLLAKNDLWGFTRPQTQVAIASQPAERWVRIAIVTETKDIYILLQAPTGEVHRFHAGDNLPDGSKLIRVSAAEVVTQQAKRKPQTFRLMD